ncbi:hypothetical protein A3Q56_08648 [Intoshia linei]|uniref:Uncharacterized protein n=1 Tax=Intoshia linei TaxID=1819745 RepID=A0A177ANL4_9BILA|nr:hypothetical protein A3Q56_08648 [Intoshia linei]
MAIGAIYGRVFGVVLEEIIRYYKDTYQFKEMCANIHGCLTPGLYALLGAAAMLGGVTKMTVSLVVIAFELTGALGYIVPLMVTSMTAKWFSDAITKYGIETI